MTSCYDCLHCDACSNAEDGGFSHLKEDASKCKYFKNKADYVEVKHGEWILHSDGSGTCSITDLDDKTLFEYHKKVSALCKELSKELLRREP